MSDDLSRTNPAVAPEVRDNRSTLHIVIIATQWMITPARSVYPATSQVFRLGVTGSREFMTVRDFHLISPNRVVEGTRLLRWSGRLRASARIGW